MAFSYLRLKSQKASNISTMSDIFSNRRRWKTWDSLNFKIQSRLVRFLHANSSQSRNSPSKLKADFTIVKKHKSFRYFESTPSTTAMPWQLITTLVLSALTAHDVSKINIVNLTSLIYVTNSNILFKVSGNSSSAANAHEERPNLVIRAWQRFEIEEIQPWNSSLSFFKLRNRATSSKFQIFQHLPFPSTASKNGL